MIGRPPQDPTRPFITLVLPAKNEAEGIGTVLSELPTRTLDLMGLESQTVVLDGDSQDHTRQVVYEHGGATVVFGEGAGKAQALRSARGHLTGDLVVMLDADGTYAADAIPRILAPLIRDDADVVMGYRRIHPGAMSPTHRFGNRALTLLASLLYQRRCRDLCTGMWGFQAEALDALPLKGTGFELEAEMFAHASRLGMRIEQVPTDYLPRMGRSKLGASDGLRIAWWLLRSRWRRLDDHESDRPRPRQISRLPDQDHREHPSCVQQPLDPRSPS